MVWHMQVITSVVLWITMVSLRKCITLEQSKFRYDNINNNKSTANASANVLLLSASDETARRMDSNHSRQINGKSFGRPGVDAERNASFDKVYLESVKRGKLAIFNFLQPYTQDRAVRLHVSANDADTTMPILFVVKEQHSVLSWQVPLITYNKMVYHNVSRTLCRVDDTSQQDNYVGITVEVSTVSSKPVNFTLLAQLISFDLSLNNKRYVSLTASQPVYLRYTFANESSVMVSVASPDETCLLFSVQEIKCPVADSVTDLNHYHGMSQTVSRNGSITVERSHFAGDSFFVVLTVLPSNYNCKRIEDIKQPGMHGDDKKKSLYIEVTSSDLGIWWLAVIAAVAWFLAIYLLTFVIACVYLTCEKRQHRRASQQVEEGSPHNNSGIDANNGVISGQMISVVEPQVEDGVHVPSSPPDSVVDSDTSMLSDIEEDKDVFRTKRSLYVCDLARKSQKALMKKYKLYYWNLIPISIFYILPVVQLMFNYTELLKVTGDQDLCYFNFKCVNPVGLLYSFNNVFSNIGYVMLGLLFLIIVHQRDVRWRKLIQENTRLNRYCGIPQQFGLFYAMGIALVMEGILSSCYHVCPNHSNFQFDTAFMYVMACLLMLCLYQKRHPDINPNAHTAYTAMSLVIFIQVIGVVYMPMTLLIMFTVVHLVCTLLLSIQIYYMGRWKLDLGMFVRVYQLLKVDRHRCAIPMYLDRICLLLIGITVNVGVDAYSLWKHPPFANYLLLIFMVNLTLYFAFYIIMKLRSHEKIRWVPACYIILGTILWGLAFFFYLQHATSWHETPARSREFNSRCILFKFYDSHDIWHFLSSMSLFFSLMTLLTLDDDLLEVPRGTIYVF